MLRDYSDAQIIQGIEIAQKEIPPKDSEDEVEYKDDPLQFRREDMNIKITSK